VKAKAVPFKIELRDASNRPMGVGRSPKIHVTEILGWMRDRVEGEAWAARKAATAAGRDDYMMLGFICENAMERALRKYIRGQQEKRVKQVEIEVDGIPMTPDARVRGSWQGIEEIKHTYRSEAAFLRAQYGGGPNALAEALEEYFEWFLLQIKCYCYGASIHYQRAYNKARLVIYFAMGDYSRGKTPHGRPHAECYELTFSAAELAETWSMILNNRKAMIRERQRERAVS
jgi:hypothetical protein